MLASSSMTTPSNHGTRQNLALPSTFAGLRLAICMSLSNYVLFYDLSRPNTRPFVNQSVESSDVCSKPAGDFDPEISSVLLNGIFRILRAAGIEIFLVEHIEDASRQVQVFSDSMSQKRDIENLIAA